MSQHALLSIERWRGFTPNQRLLMIANEMNRLRSSMRPDLLSSRKLGYERVLRLTDLTIELADRPALRRELLRWRDLVGELYLREEPVPSEHESALRALLLMSPVGADQVRALWGSLAPRAV